MFIVSAQEVPDYQDKYVNDFGNILDSAQEGYLRALFSEVESNTSAQVVFVSVVECAPYAPSDLAFQIADTWKPGDKEKDNGVVILYCVAENKIWVSTGYGLEGILPDSKVGRLLDENYVPLRDEGKVADGILLFSDAIAGVIHENREEVLAGNAGDSSSWIYLILAVLILIAFIFIISKRNKKVKHKNPAFRIVSNILFFIFFVLIYATTFLIPAIIVLILAIIVGSLAGPSGKNDGFFFMGGGHGGGFSGGGGFGGGGFGGGGAGR